MPRPETLEELKKTYKMLAMKHHPDTADGDAGIMKIVNVEYDHLFHLLKDIRTNAKGETYTAKSGTCETPDIFRNIISKIIHLDGIHIEIIGCFIWLTGNTRQYKDLFKSLKFRWHNNKSAWYLAPDEYRKRNGNIYSLDDIRIMFGYRDIESEIAKKVGIAR
jgi:curved DNA-binding protein CbpA